ncbi:cytochrome P450 [Dacryopinax primogenitus]|uniref:Cytochrome P450 n=1 Tax=Dacryopinax primogenitus (strain DJM 731) TaxID=1858805 RepID=M5FTF8_DACPD|nr:cytochrome P450 [Dacryopinax primogenitus]EJT98664.1 cytochrome P450 [Dacryopinax primogenitus]
MISLPFGLSWPVVILGLVVLYAIERAIAYYKALRDVSFLPGLTFPASMYSIPGSLLLSNEWNFGLTFNWRWRDRFYKLSPIEMTRQIGLFVGRPMMYTNSPEVVKQILAYKAPWDKLRESVQSVSPLGPNVFATTRHEWPRHRKAVSPGFHGQFGRMSEVTAVTSKFALYLIAKCGFGTRLSWNEDVGERVGGHVPSRVLRGHQWLCDPIVLLAQLVIPLRRLYDASKALEGILQGIIDKRRTEGFGDTSQDKDIFSLLLAANELEKGSKGALSDPELISNVFLLLLAGHETTSKAFAATLGD